MLKKIVVAGAIVAAAGLGLGGVALAGSVSPAAAPGAAANAVATSNTPATPTGTAGTAGTAGAKAAHHKGAGRGLAKRLERVSHAQWVSKGANGTFVTHDAARGTVSAVGTASVTVKATDGTSETFVVNSATKIRIKGSAGTPGALSGVKTGDRIGVLGTGSAPMTATRIVDRGPAH